MKQDVPKPTTASTNVQTTVYRYRIAVISCLVATAVACGYGSYRLLSDLETELGESQYQSIATHFETSILNELKSKTSAIQVLSHHVGLACPKKEMWPNCSLPLDAFEYMTSKLISSVDLKAMSFSPLVSGPEVPQFEQFAYDFFASEGEPDLAQLSFGEGIFTRDSAGDVIHDYDASNAKGTRDILVPVFEIGLLADNREAVMFNIYSETNRAQTIDYAVDCAMNAEICVAVTSPIQIVQVEGIRPAALMMVPLTPYLDNGTVVGVTVAVFFWDSTLIAAIPNSASGIFVVLIDTNNNEKYTFEFTFGRISYRGPGDLGPNDVPDSDVYFTLPKLGNIEYKIKMSSSDEFLNEYRTWVPVTACIVAICIILLTSAVFVFYDNSVRTQDELNHVLLNSKRAFVRYISHEIRTPLNTIHLGVKVLNDELTLIFDEVKTLGDKIGTNISEKLADLIDFTMDIDESNDSAVAILNDLINYDKIVVGAMMLSVGEHSVWNIIADAIRPFHIQAYKNQIKIIMDLEVSRMNMDVSEVDSMNELVVFGDISKLKQVFRNLLSNALKFSRNGGVITVTGKWVVFI
jgi:hypothetical protein